MNTEKKENFKENWIAALLVITFIITLIPIALISQYNYPSADDYGFSASAHLAFQESHSVFQAIRGAVETVIDRWHTWQGTFSTMFIMALQPGIWGENFYCLVPWIMIGLLTASSLFFLNTILVKVIKVRRSVYVSISTIHLIFVVQCMVDKTQAFFWFNGSAHYMIPHCVALTLISLWILTLLNSKYFAAKYILCCILSVFIGGSNYITALITAVLYVTAIALLFICKRKREGKLLLLPFLLFLAAFMLNALAPGNAVRQAMNTNRPGVIKSILLSFYYCAEYITETWFDWTWIIFILALLPFIWELVKATGNRFSYRFPLLIAAFSYCLLSAMFTPSLYASGIAGGGRIFNIIFLDTALLIIGNLYYFMGWLYTHGILKSPSEASALENKNVLIYLAGILCLTLFVSFMYIQVDPDHFTSSSAAASLLSGEAAAYGEEAETRIQLIREAKSNDDPQVEIPRYTIYPYLLFFSDINPDPSDWINNSMARYYDFDSVIGR